MVLQSENWANRTVEEKVSTIQKAMIPALPSDRAPVRRKRALHFRIVSFLLVILLLLPVDVVRSSRTVRSIIYGHELIRERRGFQPTVYFCTLKNNAMQSCIWRFSSFFIRRLLVWRRSGSQTNRLCGEDAICNDIASYKWPLIGTTVWFQD